MPCGGNVFVVVADGELIAEREQRLSGRMYWVVIRKEARPCRVPSGHALECLCTRPRRAVPRALPGCGVADGVHEIVTIRTRGIGFWPERSIDNRHSRNRARPARRNQTLNGLQTARIWSGAAPAESASFVNARFE